MNLFLELPRFWPCLTCGMPGAWAIDWDAARREHDPSVMPHVQFVCLTCRPRFRPIGRDRLVVTLEPVGDFL